MIVAIVFSVLAVFSVGGLIATAVVGMPGEEYGVYGDVPIPGSGSVYLSAGEVVVSFHIDGHRGSGMTVPPLTMDVTPPPGVRDPGVKEDLGSTVSNNGDAHRRVWLMQVPAEGGYQITTSGPVDGYENPRLAFGRVNPVDGLLWVFVAISVVFVDLAIAAWWLRHRSRERERPTSVGSTATGEAFVPTDTGVRLEQLKTIAALRDSGALTNQEFEAEKRRILGEG